MPQLNACLRKLDASDYPDPREDLKVDPLIWDLATKGYFIGTPLRDLLFGSSLKPLRGLGSHRSPNGSSAPRPFILVRDPQKHISISIL